MKSNHESIFFNAQHSPIGAFASFTLGYPGANGGLGLELGKPADQNIYIGCSGPDGSYELLPFYAGSDNERQRYVQAEGESEAESPALRSFPLDAVTRDYKAATDEWRAGDLSFRILTQIQAVPDPHLATEEEVKAALVPAVWAELTLDNTSGVEARTLFFGYQGNDPYSNMRRLDDTMPSGYCGIGQGLRTAVVTEHAGTYSSLGFDMESILRPRSKAHHTFGLGSCGALLTEVPAGEKVTVRYAICFYQAGIVTSGLPGSYYYTRLFQSIESVARYALERFDAVDAVSGQLEEEMEEVGLSEDQKFLIRHSVHSYYGSTELLDVEGKPVWIVNEGEYRMINTLDLTVDQLFFEMKMNPWTVRNVLDLFAERYSYKDEVQEYGNPEKYEGGISFTHDMGVANVFSRPQYSAYEISEIEDCFSYMTQEQLTNWLLCALVYAEKTQDRSWLADKMGIIKSCFSSMLNRDHHNAGLRDGMMDLESSRTNGGAEITTYDSLDVSLGQSRRNIYIASKCWAVYVMLADLFVRERETELAIEAAEQAARCASTVMSGVEADGTIPAILDGESVSRIIPAIEGLVYPYAAGLFDVYTKESPYAGYLSALKKHLENILVPGVCLFADGGWQLSSTSINSWSSKIYLNQFVARQVLGVIQPEQQMAADHAHVSWLKDPQNAYWAWSDQTHEGFVKGSRYYPRGVTSILWLEERRG
ncbi:glycoside hydrolase family 52 protein [Paenibacillus sp. MMO-58]|uniref:glycoside hydrolase family 52 protein n=1 Tax=Paenibacillus sp. MMO-58 TaxID=3081290 RepID=UPI0030176DFD